MTTILKLQQTLSFNLVQEVVAIISHHGYVSQYICTGCNSFLTPVCMTGDLFLTSALNVIFLPRSWDKATLSWKPSSCSCSALTIFILLNPLRIFNYKFFNYQNRRLILRSSGNVGRCLELCQLLLIYMSAMSCVGLASQVTWRWFTLP